MSFFAIDLLLPMILAIHNAEELSRYDDFVSVYHSKLAERFRTQRVLRVAAILLTLTVAATSILTDIYKSEILIRISEAAIFGLMFNAIGHCILSLKRREMPPGTLSAVTLVLPYAVVAVRMMRIGLGESTVSLIGLAVLGACGAPIAVVLFLSIGYGLSRA